MINILIEDTDAKLKYNDISGVGWYNYLIANTPTVVLSSGKYLAYCVTVLYDTSVAVSSPQHLPKLTLWLITVNLPTISSSSFNIYYRQPASFIIIHST